MHEAQFFSELLIQGESQRLKTHRNLGVFWVQFSKASFPGKSGPKIQQYFRAGCLTVLIVIFQHQVQSKIGKCVYNLLSIILNCHAQFWVNER